MARLQILELPEGSNDDRPPFVLVVDQYVARRYVQGIGQTAEPIDEFDGLAEKVGARAVLVFEETVDIPANEITLSDAADGNVVRVRVEPDLTGFTDAVMAEVAEARTRAGLRP
ncbi:hypothetical protein [Streptomyces sp. STCH 565 A]|uniref:hypothetical protein n=1 Tax=Streptomyces sp. STCH 565 A TaxID=2950532 RepID=UPI002074DA60|nr:hypothetical protein [Streptomyces sp. STCH 565 A]MCM8548900.1 hypothetical protein [Streptomyces sp. STCH 565 A]